MKKIKLYGVGNEGTFNYYIFDKTKEVHMVLEKLFKMFNLEWPLQEEKLESKDKEYMVDVDISKNKDIHDTIHNERNTKKYVRADIFYGDKKMFITLHCSQEDRAKFNQALFRLASLPEPTKDKGELK